MQITALRQFARAASGDQMGGDELARLIMAHKSMAEGEDTVTASQIASFLRLWRAEAERSHADARAFTDDALWRSMPAPPAVPRLLLLLTDVLGIPLSEAAGIVGLEADEAADLLKSQREALKPEPGSRAIIVEDEPIIRDDLESVLRQVNVESVGWAESVSDAIDLCVDRQPDLIIADYNLGDENFDGEALRRLRRVTDAPVIFVTGFPEEVLTGESFEPDFVIAKPYRAEAITAAVAHSLATSPSIRNEEL
ncbi:MAG: response regulator [Minwuia sp.]|uniref:response regulator n=1 Tax=Minwuia sp. TaxID=2493630 RepID=UPI003A8691C7